MKNTQNKIIQAKKYKKYKKKHTEKIEKIRKNTKKKDFMNKILKRKK